MPLRSKSAAKPAAIVLSMVGTGMATVRSLALAGIDVHVATFIPGEPIQYSRWGQKTQLFGMEKDEPGLLGWLLDYTRQLGNRPVVFPTCDEHALLLAKYAGQLQPHCRVWNNTADSLRTIVHKEKLYQAAAAAGVEIVPMLCEPTAAEVEQWSREHPGPYLLKPSYEGIAACALRDKNLQLTDRAALLDHVDRCGTTALVIQRLIRGGDGHIFDCYGLCGADGRPITLATHRRLRQHLPDFGATCYGEIPANVPGVDQRLLDNTARLFEGLHYHGIFGIEWLQDRSSGALYMIDFNARPFSTIGHLRDCGLNLPLLAYRELTGADLSAQPLQPPLRHKYWIDLVRDIETCRSKRESGELGRREWLYSLLRCRSFAYWDWRDPGPGLYVLWQIARRALRFLRKRVSPAVVDGLPDTAARH